MCKDEVKIGQEIKSKTIRILLYVYPVNYGDNKFR